MENITAKIEKKTRKVFLTKSVIGNDGENLQEKLVFSFDEFVNGTARLELNRNNTKSYLMLTKVDNTYELPVKSLITKVGKLDLQLVITEGTNENEIPIFKSNVFFVIVNPSINAEIEEEEEYPQWIDVANTKLNEIDEALDDLQNKVDSGYFKGEKGDKGDNGEQGIQGIPGRDGVDGTNGRDGYVQYTAGDNITIENNVISASGGTTYDENNKLYADYVDDTSSTNKFVTSSEKQTWDAKEDTSNKVSTIDNSSTNVQYPGAKAVWDLVSSMGGGFSGGNLKGSSSGDPFIFENNVGVFGNITSPFETFNCKINSSTTLVRIYNITPILLIVYKNVADIGTPSEDTYFATLIASNSSTSGTENGKVKIVNFRIQPNGTLSYVQMNLKMTFLNSQEQQTFEGIKTFVKFPKVSGTPTEGIQLVNKQYVDNSIASAITTTLNGSY